MNYLFLWKRFFFAALFVVICAPAFASGSATDFYRGRNVEIIVGTGPGGGYDLNARLVARHMGRFIPGNPRVFVTNMIGAGGITAANLLFNVSSREGGVIGTFSNALLTAPLLASGAIKFEPRQFHFIGSVSREDGICVTSKQSGAETWKDILQNEVVIGTTAPGTTTYMYPTMLRNLFGARFRVVAGYPDGSAIVMALERGESQAICQTFSSLNAQHPEWLVERKVNPIIALGLEANPKMKDVPLIMDLARDDEERLKLKIMLAPTAAGRPFMTPPGVPADRLAALRAAFNLMVDDTDFRSDAVKQRVDVEPMSGLAIHSLLDEVYGSSKETISSVRRLMGAE